MVGTRIVLIAVLAPASWGQTAPSQASLTQSTKPNEPVPVITIERTGGFAGVYDQVAVFADGRMMNEDKVRQISPALLEVLIRSIEKVATPATAQPSLPQSLCSDCFMYRLTIRSGDTVKTFLLAEPVIHPSAKDSQDIKGIRQFLASAFGNSYRK